MGIDDHNTAAVLDAATTPTINGNNDGETRMRVIIILWLMMRLGPLPGFAYQQ